MPVSTRQGCHRSGVRRCRLAALAALPLLVFTPQAWSQDTVYLLPADDGSGRLKVSGEIVDYTGKELRLRVPTGKERTIPTQRVASISTRLSAEHTAADAFFARNDFRQALEQYRRVLSGNHESRDWVRRQILAQIVWCQRSLGQTEEAVDSFLSLVGRDPTTQFFDCIPLTWLPAQGPAGLEKKAHAWLAQTNVPAAELIAASYLLSTERAVAVERLDRLSTDLDPRIAGLAEAQRWRATSFNVSDVELNRRLRGIERIPSSLRAGPYYVVGSALAARKPDDAALALLRVPIAYPRERALAASALRMAGACLEKSGQTQEATTLYQELVREHGDAPEAAEIRERLPQ